MSKSAEMSRKEMKEPDRFQAVAGQAAGWVAARRRPVLAAAVVAAALAAAALVVMALSERRNTAAGAMLSKVYEAAGAVVSPVPLPNVPGPFYPSDEARQRAVVEAADHLLAEAPGARAASAARLARADALLRLGEPDKAVEGYQAYLASAPVDEPLRFSGLEGLALAEEARGRTDAALAALARLAAEVPARADHADLERARLLAASGKAGEARALLEAFPEAHKDSPLAGEAAERLARLGGK
jgi:tetratricopeptide (TPR) repeat protein